MKDKFGSLNGAKCLCLGIFLNYLVFIPAIKHIKYFHGTAQIYTRKSKGMSKESIKDITKSDRNFAATFVDHYLLPDININGHCLIKNHIAIPWKVINLYISYTLSPQLRNCNTDFALSNCLFGSVRATKNTDLHKYKYTVYGIGFDSRGEYCLPNGSIGKIVIISGVDMSLFVHINSKRILILAKGPTEGLDGTTFIAEALHRINFTQFGKRFVLSLHYNGSNSFLFVKEELRKFMLCS